MQKQLSKGFFKKVLVLYVLRERGQKFFYFDCIFAGVLLKTGDLHLKDPSNLLQRVAKKENIYEICCSVLLEKKKYKICCSMLPKSIYQICCKVLSERKR